MPSPCKQRESKQKQLLRRKEQPRSRNEPYRIGRAGPPADNVGEVSQGDPLVFQRRCLGSPSAGILRRGRRRQAAAGGPARHWSGCGELGGEGLSSPKTRGRRRRRDAVCESHSLDLLLRTRVCCYSYKHLAAKLNYYSVSTVTWSSPGLQATGVVFSWAWPVAHLRFEPLPRLVPCS